MITWANVGFVKTNKGSDGKIFSKTPDVSFLDGKRILKAGFLDRKELSPGEKLDESGFAIDYETDDSDRRVVFGFNDLGLWIIWHGELGKENAEDELKRKICSVWDELVCQKISIVDKPLERRYAFVGENDSELLSLSLGDLKIMSSEVAANFHQTGNKDAEKIIGDIGMWAYN